MDKKQFAGRFEKTRIKVPQNCPCCGMNWQGGSQIPGKNFKTGLRVFYECGCSMSVSKVPYGYTMLIKNCDKVK